jgi:hypothetical protein
MMTHVDRLQRAAPDEPHRAEIGKVKSPTALDQFADELIPETLDKGHRFTPRLCRETIAKHKVCIIRRCNHNIEIVRVIAAIGVAKKNPRGAAWNVLQPASTCVAISAPRFAEHFGACGTSAVGGRISATVVDHTNSVKPALPQLPNNAGDSRLLV